jgi:hypothetical protein
VQAFDGTPFWFHGVPGHFYNLISEQNEFQVWAIHQHPTRIMPMRLHFVRRPDVAFLKD